MKPGVYRTFGAIVGDGQARLKLVDFDPQRGLHVALRADPLTDIFLYTPGVRSSGRNCLGDSPMIG
jgi:hypothetical protein